MSDQKLVAYKGFDKDMKCRGFAYEVGKEYTHAGDVSPCNSGFHACTKASDVWSYYGPAESRYARVELSGTVVPHAEDSKHASSQIKVIEEITPVDFMKLVIAEIFDGATSKEPAASGHYSKLAASGDYSKLAASGDSSQLAASGASSQLAASGDYSQLAASGDYSKLAASGDSSQLAASGASSQLAASGDYSKLAASGDSSQLAASGHYSKLAASGHYSQLAASGHYSKLAASGHYSKLAASGDYSKLAASGDSSQLAASGDYSQLAASGAYSVIASSSVLASAKGGDGTWIALAEYDGNDKCIGFAVGCIGQDGLEADTWYKASGGKLVRSDS